MNTTPKILSKNSMRVLIMAGGTGGHILPALAVAKALQAENIEVHWLGTEHGLEHQLIPPTHIPIHYITVYGVRGKGIKNLLAAPFRMLYAAWQARCVIKKLQPKVVIGFGGFVSAPGGFAAWLLRKPLLIHEQNAVAGMTNRCLAYLATQVFQAFPSTFPQRVRAIICGNPVRAEILSLPTPQQRFASHLQNKNVRLLILGGSQGATLLNQIVPEALNIVREKLSVEVWHSTGKSGVEKTSALYHQLKISAQVAAFISDMSAAYAWADLVICRAGALTVAELAAAGVASILIPYPHAVDDHQTKNGMWLVNAGAAVLMQQKELDAEKLAALLINLSADKNKLLQMACAARDIAITDATRKIVAFCVQKLCRVD